MLEKSPPLDSVKEENMSFEMFFKKFKAISVSADNNKHVSYMELVAVFLDEYDFLAKKPIEIVDLLHEYCSTLQDNDEAWKNVQLGVLLRFLRWVTYDNNEVVFTKVQDIPNTEYDALLSFAMDIISDNETRFTYLMKNHFLIFCDLYFRLNTKDEAQVAIQNCLDNPGSYMNGEEEISFDLRVKQFVIPKFEKYVKEKMEKILIDPDRKLPLNELEMEFISKNVGVVADILVEHYANDKTVLESALNNNTLLGKAFSDSYKHGSNNPATYRGVIQALLQVKPSLFNRFTTYIKSTNFLTHVRQPSSESSNACNERELKPL